MDRQPRGRRWAGLSFLVLLSLTAAGCGKATGTVTGKVTFKNEPLAYGYVKLITSDGHVASGPIGTDGTYTVNQAPLGEARVTVEAVPLAPTWPGVDAEGKMLTPQQLAEMKKPVPPPSKQTPVSVPPRYQNPEQSGLSVTVTRGTTPYDIALKP